MLCYAFLKSRGESARQHQKAIAHIASVIDWRRTNVRFNNCVRASRPVLAVMDEAIIGQLRINQRIFGSMKGLRKLTLTRCCGDARTALRVTSEPVPAVVGWQ